jgi:hypothetical protein
MLAPQSGQTRLRIAEIKLEFGFVTTASEAMMSLPTTTVLRRRKHRTLSGAAGAFGESACWMGGAALASIHIGVQLSCQMFCSEGIVFDNLSRQSA